MKKILVMLLVVIAASLSFLTYSADAETNVDAKALFEKKCSLCHEIERPKSMRQTRAEWEVTLNWMKSMSDADISDEEARIILDHLVANYGK